MNKVFFILNAYTSSNRVILVTGSAGFIGFHLANALLDLGIPVIGIDNINSYYDKSLKKARLKKLHEKSNQNSIPFENHIIDINNLPNLEDIFNGKSSSIEYLKKNRPTEVVNLAAQAGVRYSIENPSAYIKSNINGFLNILECSKKFEINHLIYASSSSVYGGNTSLPFKEDQNVDHPISIYAASKKANELMAHSYSHLYNLPTTGLRFFTVYGPWGRPDMAPMIFADAILNNKELKIYNNGNNSRDFTYIDDVINVIAELIHIPAVPNKDFDKKNPEQSTSWAPYRLFNVGGNKSVSVLKFIDLIEEEIGMKANKIMYPMQLGDVIETYADTFSLESILKNKTQTNLEDGIRKFIKWYLEFYDLKI